MTSNRSVEHPPSSPRLNLSYAYQNNGSIQQIVDATRSETLNYTYDELDRLDTVSGAYPQNYDYNPIGNITSKDTSANPGTANLVSWWRMNEASGTRTDGHGTNHLTDNNTVGSTTGKQGNAALFALASSEYLSIADNTSLSMGSGARMTTCAWVKLNSKNATQIQEFVAKSGSANGSWEYFLRYDGVSDWFEFVVTSDGYNTTQVEVHATSQGSPAIGAWYFLCGGYDGTNLWVSVNAGTRDTVAYSADIYDGASTNALQIGRYAGGSQYLNGALDEVLLYKRSLNAGEVSWLYNAGVGRTYADLSAGSPTTYTYNASHKHAVASLSTGETYTYDANGNMTQRVEGGLTYTQTFDAENRLISVAVSGQTTQFIYDGDGNLVKKINPNGSKTLYVGGIYEVDKASGGSVTRTVTYYPVAGAMRINSTLYYTLKDHLGSASVVTDASGNILGEQRYYPFGETRLTTGTIYTDKLYTGQREMAGLGIYHYQARFYSPKLGRFLSPDTIIPGAANPQAFNRYSYVLNNPIRYIDPTGHVCSDPDDPTPSCSSGNPYPNNTQPLPSGPVVINNPGPLDPGLPQGGGGGDDDGNYPSYSGCYSLGLSNSTCVGTLYAFQLGISTVDFVALGFSAAEAAWADAIYAAAILISLFFPQGAPELLLMAIKNDIATAGALGVIENRLGYLSFGATATSDWLAGNTYIAKNGDWYVGKDTLVSLTTTAVGIIPESNLDLIASAYQFGYDLEGLNGRTGGSLNISNITLQSFLTIFPRSMNVAP